MDGRRRTLVNVAVTLLVVVVITATLSWLRDTAPLADTSGLLVEEARVPPGQLLTCERLVSDDQDDLPIPGRAISGLVLECPGSFDGRLVTYVGEVVGDVLRRDGGSWLLVNDDAYALVSGPLLGSGEHSGTNSGLAVWVPAPTDRLVTTPGRAGRRGDVVEVTGHVRRADPDDGGGLTIRAREVEVLADGVEVPVPVHWRQVAIAGVLAAVTLLLVLRDRREAD